MPKLEFEHKKELTYAEKKVAMHLIAYLNRCNEKDICPTGAHLASKFKTSATEVRKVIQNIREHNDEFFKGKYLISFNSGYKITKNKKEIAKWAKKQHLRAVSGLAQVEQTYKITKKGW